jgi:CRP/FNR family cyclic AMP-dependent transcriptional regulator
VDLLAHDRELRRLVPTGGAGRNGQLWAIELRLDRGPWDPGSEEPAEDHLGFMVLDGLIGRRCFVPERGRSLELLGKGDLLRPWQEDAASFSEVSWSVIEPASVAVLGDSVAARAREMPEFLEILTERALRRSRRLAVSAAIANTVGVEDRLLLLLWQLAELWGEKRRGGALLPFRLSHQTLADLVGARRPTVTLAVRALTQRELLERGESGEWMLPGSPP